MTREEWLKENPLRKWREARGWSSYELARHLSVTLQGCLHWERGRCNPSTNYWMEITMHTGITPEEWAAWRSREPRDDGEHLQEKPA